MSESNHKVIWKEKLKWYFDQMTPSLSGSDKVSIEELNEQCRQQYALEYENMAKPKNNGLRMTYIAQ